ncbi:hypothetical protein AVEN_177725-1 [Araneus ventricosus]|uniref:Uncharacterized protein n=1 Tax=Araneus ventricosus TaxID=182803 RepID=A0A4Y2UDG3_ARAVE|nr:hypothetical protein AVEN_177725-1 [Araneus ventricosus]
MRADRRSQSSSFETSCSPYTADPTSDANATKIVWCVNGENSPTSASSRVRRDENHLIRDPGCREGVPMFQCWTCLEVLHIRFRERKSCFHTCFRNIKLSP